MDIQANKRVVETLKKDLLENSSLKVSTNDLKKITVSLFSTIKFLTDDNERVIIRGFGTFLNKKTKPRIGRNPQTKELFNIKERTILKFRAN